nr:hypothetical protein [Anaerolinea sp.]
QWVAAGYGNQTVQVWASGGGPARRSLTGSGSPASLVFSPKSNRIASGAVDVWTLDTAQRVASSPRQFGPYQDMVLSPDGGLGALAGYGRIEMGPGLGGHPVRTGPERCVRWLSTPAGRPSWLRRETAWRASTR